MGIFSYISEKKKSFQQQQRMRTQERLESAKAELKVLKAEGQVYTETAKLRNELKKTKKDIFKAKYPIVSAALENAGKRIEANKKAQKGIFAKDNTPNPFMNFTPSNNPFDFTGQQKKKKKR